MQNQHEITTENIKPEKFDFRCLTDHENRSAFQTEKKERV
jgi:hypothetical protein